MESSVMIEITPVPDDGSTVGMLARHLERRSGYSQTQAEISAELGVSIREVQDAIQALRTKHGVPICSGDGGIWLPTTREEAEEMIARLHSRSVTQLTTISGMKKGLEMYFGPKPEPVPVQESLFNFRKGE